MTAQIDPRLETQRVAGLVVKALTDLGHAWRREDGGIQTVKFTTVGYGDVAGSLVAVLEVDTQRLPRKVSARDLTRSETLHHLATVCGHPLRCLNTTGVTYVVRLTPPLPPPRLPTRVPLELDGSTELAEVRRPAGDLLVPMGVGREGAVWCELPALGHTLITGTSGSGKSSWIHAGLAGLVSGAERERLQVALVDPKRSEFAAWASAPQLYGPIATDEASAVRLLEMLVGEMERRGDLLAGALARDLSGYNRRAAAPLPYLLIVVDEVLDLLLGASNRRIETALMRLAAKGRSAGVLLWIATQHARFDLLPRTVGLNLSSRLVFRVQDANAANLAGCPGAEQIPRSRPGRMLARLDGPPVLMQAYYVDDTRLHELVGGLGVTPAAPPELDELDAQLVRYAITDLGGRFTIHALVAAFAARTTHYRVRTLAERLERRGLLATPEGPKAGRRVTAELKALVNGR